MSQPAVNCEIVNMAEFQQTLNKYLAHTSRDLPTALNTKMFFIARGASRLTPKQDRSKIEQELGVIGYAVKVGKRGKPLTRKGKPRWEKIYSRDTKISHLIINARRGRAGEKGLYGHDMTRAVAEMIRKRGRSVGTLKAGWQGAIKTFGAAVGESGDAETLASHIKGRTRTSVAKPGFSPICSLEYLTNSYIPYPSHAGYIDNRTQKALGRSYADEMRSMDAYIIKKLQERVNRMSKP
jgi:hypothetical protein